MSFCNISSELQKSSTTIIDNLFIADYMPNADPKFVNVYIYGLYLAQKDNNSSTDMAKELGISENDIILAYKYWEQQNLIQITNREPLEVVYLPVKTALIVNKKFNPNKYKDFNTQVLGLLPDRVITPSEFNEYYSLIETEGFDPSALVMIIKYCADKKGSNVGYKYIITVAKNYALQNILTVDQVAEKLSSHSKYTEDISNIFKALKIKREIEFEDIQLYTKWVEDIGFKPETILFAAKKQKGKGGMKKLDSQIEEYIKINAYTSSDIENYENKKEELYQLTYKINRIIGVHYDIVDSIVDTYTSNWVERGYTEDSLSTIATYCFRHSIKTLEGMNSVVEKFYDKGLLTSEAINQHVNTLIESDREIQKVLDKANLARNITTNDRRSYKTWKELWHFNDDIIMYAAELSRGTTNPVAYMNKLLSIWLDQNITTVDAAKKTSIKVNKVESNERHRDYTKEELNALFDDIGDIKL